MDLTGSFKSRKICLQAGTLFEACRTEPVIEDVALAFDRYKIDLNELDEFITYVDLPEFAKEVVQFPCPQENKLDFVDDPDNSELQSRIHDEDKEHVDYFYPLMERIGE